MSLSNKEVLAQSNAAYEQWKDVWKDHALKNGEKFKKDGNSHKDLLYEGSGKNLLCIAMGASLEQQIDVVKNNLQDHTEIMCVDKALGPLLDNGIKPKYVMLADAQISYDDYCKKYIEETEDIILFANVTANVDWTLNWKGKVFFFVNKDNINTQDIYSPMSGCFEQIPASSNVGNSVVVFATQILGYNNYFLLGYDYGFGENDNYYAFQDSPKRYWMGHMHLIDKIGRLIKTSGNLLFSARWLTDFNNNMARPRGIKIYNCSGQGLLSLPGLKLEKALKKVPKKKTQQEINQMGMKLMEEITLTAKDGIEKLQHYLQTLKVQEIKIKHIPERAFKLLGGIECQK